ncbi:stage II sporulation protein M [Brevibacillus sp. LEMMJ03]|uniref:stage II sporulation protein M n=1 Tax=Brevibacillus sp. LEMMJ03 TaxID=2595056 RepID=UPI00117CD6C1|nr:stage II sporulation protein M [Brevibacillus sp. LEMMJ03]TRY23827.1 stage II sporulation protein M [Brevibacillus sp. LEMMJ03]
MNTRFRRLWTDNKWYIVTACLLFLGGAMVGFLQSHAVHDMVSGLMDELKDMAQRIRDSGQGVTALFWAIFVNNVTSSLMMMALGLFFAVFPVIGMVANGVLFGYILAQYSAAGISPWLIFAVGILPHGIIELPTVLFAAGVGMRLGVLSLRSVGGLFQPSSWERVKNDWYDVLKQFPTAVLTVIGLLFVAAVVESVVTPLLLHSTIGEQLQQVKWLQ